MAATAEDDHCAVCAEPMAWAAYGRCGHRDACSKCVVRMRAVLRDDRCVICQQPCDAVLVTRAVGAYTRVLPAEAFDEFKVKRGGGERRRAHWPKKKRAAARGGAQPPSPLNHIIHFHFPVRSPLFP